VPELVKAEGICYHRDIGLNPTMGEACDLNPVTPKVALKEGMVTSNGLVPSGRNGGALNAAVWVLGGFGTIGTPATQPPHERQTPPGFAGRRVARLALPAVAGIVAHRLE
jgi:hypothetical protein